MRPCLNVDPNGINSKGELSRYLTPCAVSICRKYSGEPRQGGDYRSRTLARPPLPCRLYPSLALAV
jgi:hypothetical protein